MEIRIVMYNLTDTGDRDHKMYAKGFSHVGYPRGWPGREVAVKYITSLWALYLMHEAQELVTYRGVPLFYRSSELVDGRSVAVYRESEVPVVDAHGHNSVSQLAIERSGDIASTLDWSLGLGAGAELVKACEERAKIELQNEIDFVAGRGARWE